MEQKIQDNPSKRHKFTKGMRITLSVGICAVLIGAIAYYREHYVWTNDAFVEAYGVDLSTNVTEQVIELLVDEGDIVKKGQLLAVLQKNVPLAEKDQAIAAIASAEQGLLVAEARYLKIRNDYERAVQGIEDQIISVQTFDHYEKDFKMAQAEYDLAFSNLEVAKKQLAVVDARLIHYELRATEDAIVAKRWVWIGDVIQPGQSLYTLYDLQDVWILANIREKRMRNIQIGDKVLIHIDVYPFHFFEGEVFAIKGAAASQFTLVPQNNATGNYTKVEQRLPIKISIKKPANFPEDKPLYLFPGISAEVWIKTSP
jgi:membrane fusion protein, multidrug efflux system